MGDKEGGMRVKRRAVNTLDGRSDARYGHMLPSQGDQNWEKKKEDIL